jgi:hypothetical protein
LQQNRNYSLNKIGEIQNGASTQAAKVSFEDVKEMLQKLPAPSKP